jgi:hypothetical protein
VYTGEIQVVSDDITPLLAMAGTYGVNPLKEACGELLAKQLNDDSVFYLLVKNKST